MCVRVQSPETLFTEIFHIDYLNRDNETGDSRGSIPMKIAILRVSDTEQTRFKFEIHSRSHHLQWFMEANDSVEAHQWIQAIAKSIKWYKMRESADSDAFPHHHPHLPTYQTVTR